MPNGYTKASPSPFNAGDIIDAADFTTEFNAIDLAFGTDGHDHTGGAGKGPKITTAGLADNAVTPAILKEDESYDMDGLTVDSLTVTSGTAVTSIDTDLSSVSNADDTLASAKAIKAYVDAQVTASDLDFQGDSGGALSIDLDSETLDIAGGTGIDTTGSGNTLTVAIDSTVATLTGSQTLTNKTLGSSSAFNATTGTAPFTVASTTKVTNLNADTVDGKTAPSGTIVGTSDTQTLTNKTLTSPDIDTPDIDGGNIDNTIIGATTVAAGSFSTVSTTGNITVGGTVDGRDVATDGTKLDGVEASADVTDATNVTNAGALMDSEVTNLAQVKAFDSSDYATSAQGGKADTALQAVPTNGVGVTQLALSEGTNGQFLKTDGAGTISFASAPAQGTTFSTIDINGGAIDGVTIGTSSAVTDLRVDNIKIDGNTISNTDSTSGIILAPNGNDDVTIDFNTDGTGTFVLTTTNTGTQPPKMEFFKNTSSPATIDKIGQLDFYGKDAGGATRAYGSMSVISTNVDSGASEGTFIFTSYVNNIGTTALRITDGAITSPFKIITGGFAPTVRYDTNASGGVTTSDYSGYYDFEIGVAGGTLVESAMVLDANWVGDTNATKNNCRFGLSVIQGNETDTASVIVSNTPAGHGDTVVFGNLQHNSNGTTDVVNGLSINGSVINIGSTISGATIKLKNSTTITGSLSKSSGSFKIDHPLESKTATHHLVHSFVESPTADNIYRGKVALVSGSATVNIDTLAGMTDGTFAALNREVQCFTSNESGWTAVKGSVSGNTLTITAQEDTCTDTVSWLVVGERKDAHMYDTGWTDDNGKVIVEPEKEA